MKPRKTTSAHLLTVGIMTLLVVGALVAYQVYSALTKQQITKVQELATMPLDGSIKEKVINNLIGRRWFNRVELDRPIIVNPPVAEESLEIEDLPADGSSPDIEPPPDATETGKVEEE